MRIGLGLPNGGKNPQATDLVELAVQTEKLGLDSVWVADRWLRPHHPVTMPGVDFPVTMPVESYRVVFDPIEVLTFIAARTERISLGTSAINVLYHPPVLLARRLATLDQFSQGRLIAGVTSGWMTEEFAVAGVPRDYIGRAFDDHLAAMRRVWGSDPVSYQGTHYTIPLSDIGPKPYHERAIPLIAGYNTRAGIRRVAQIADGIHPFRNDLDQLTTDLALWRETASAAGKDITSMPIVLRVAANPTSAVSGTLRKPFTGPVVAWRDDLDHVSSLGVDHIFFQFNSGMETAAILQIMAQLARLTGR